MGLDQILMVFLGFHEIFANKIQFPILVDSEVMIVWAPLESKMLPCAFPDAYLSNRKP